MRAEYLFDAFFAHRITPAEQEELDALLKTDAAAKAEFGFQLEIREAFRLKERRELKANLQRLEQRPEGIPHLKWWAVAASIVVLIGVAWYFGLHSNQKDYSELYSAHFEVYPNVVVPLERSGSGEVPNLTKEAFDQYENEAYEEAYLSFRQLHEKEGEEYAFFYAAVSLMASEKYAAAIDRFESKDTWESQRFETASKWYLALAYLKAGDEKNAIKYLEEVRDSEHALNQPAGELLLELE